MAYFWGFIANFGQNHPNSHAKSNLPRYLYVMNYNFVTTEQIFKIQNSAESYCLAESEYSSPNALNLPLFCPPPPSTHTKSNFIHQRWCHNTFTTKNIHICLLPLTVGAQKYIFTFDKNICRQLFYLLTIISICFSY